MPQALARGHKRLAAPLPCHYPCPMPVEAPTLTTDRLILRAHRRDDVEALAQMWADPDVTRHIGGKPATRQESWFRLLRYGGLWPMLGFGYWAITDKASGRYLGDAGLADFQRGMGAGFDGLPEAGWALVPDAFGRGLATEAMQGVLAWADTTLAAPRTVCMIDPGNTASLRVAAKLGFVQTRPAPPEGGAALFERQNSAQIPGT